MKNLKMTLHDAHLHIKNDRLVHVLKEAHIECIANAANDEEYHFLKQMQKEYKGITISFGIHPWNSETYTFEQMLPYLNEACIIGEIGMDKVWCDCDLQKQQSLFEQQLAFASNHHKPVILHTKGMEKEILSCIKKYPNTYLVHWYSCDQYLQEYIDYGCYFTIGASVMMDEAVYQVALEVPLQRMLLESDGIDALSWAFDKVMSEEDYVAYLHQHLQLLATLRHVNYDDLLRQLHNNYHRFINSKECI